MKKFLNILLVTVFAVFSLHHAAFAKKSSKKSSSSDEESYGGAPWGMAGCGLWAGIIKGKDKSSQLGVYALRNLVLNSQTSAITSGTSNCVHEGSAYAQKEKEVFVTVNLASLEREAAQGQGQHLNAFAEILGCPDHDAFANFSQDNYNSIFKTQEPNGVLKNYLDEVKKDQQLKKQCVRIS